MTLFPAREGRRSSPSFASSPFYKCFFSSWPMRYSKQHRLRLFDNFLHLADFLLDCAADLFADTFAFQVRIVRHPADCFLNLALYFVNRANYLILSTWFHLFVSYESI